MLSILTARHMVRHFDEEAKRKARPTDERRGKCALCKKKIKGTVVKWRGEEYHPKCLERIRGN